MSHSTADQVWRRVLAGGPASRGLRVFIDPSSYHNDNAGELGTLTVALQRVRTAWPNAAVTVHTLDPQAIHAIDPATDTLEPFGARAWSADAYLAVRAPRLRRCTAVTLQMSRWIKRRQPWLMRALGSAVLRSTRRSTRALHEYLHAMSNADLVIMSGANRLNDAFRLEALIRLETLELAHQAGAITALLAQGLGPMHDPLLRTRAAQVLPHVDLITLREAPASLALLDSLGITLPELSITGDDSVALGYQARAPQLGSALGVNLRVAQYAGIDTATLAVIGATLRNVAEHFGVELLPLPFSRRRAEDDLRTTHLLLGAASRPLHLPAITDTAPVLGLLNQCRIAVVGSYHAAVLALSMGIPVVAIAGSEYYAQQLRGAIHQFGGGCQVELTSHPDLAMRLRTAIASAWITAGATRDALLRAARNQIDASEAAYHRMFELVETKTWQHRYAAPYGMHPDQQGE